MGRRPVRYYTDERRRVRPVTGRRRYRMPRKRELWMREAFDPEKKGRLHRQLGIPQNERIPTTLLEEIRETPIGETVKNPTQRGRRRYRVTSLLKKRAVLALTARRVRD